MLKKPYCENCFRDGLEEYVIDGYGSLFCSEECFKQSYEYREKTIQETPLTFYKKGEAMN